MVSNLSEKALNKLKTPIFGASNNQAFPYNHDEFFQKIFNENKRNRLTKLQSINEKMTDISDELINEMTKLLKEIKIYESSHKNLLIELVKNYIFEKYSLDDELIELNCKLNDKLQTNRKTMDDIILEYDDFETLNKHNDKIKQRLIIDSLIDGSSRDYSDFLHNVYSEIADINPLLPMKYNKIGSMASYLPYLKDSEKLMDGGDFIIDYPNNQNDKIIIKCCGFDLLSLFFSLNKAILTLIVNNSLKNNKEQDITTIKESIKNKYHPFLSDYIWESCKKSMNKINESSFHYILYEMASMEISDFNTLMKEILFKTKKSKLIINEICDKINYKLSN